MGTVEHRVYNIARTAIDRAECAAWLVDCGVTLGAIARLLEGEGTDCAKLVRLAGKRCYMAFEAGINPNVSRVRDDIAAYIDHILASGHGSVLEHVTYTFAIEGVSRVLTAELNRHRAGVAVSEGSMRYIRFRDIPYWEPLSIREAPGDDPDIAEKRAQSRAVFVRAFEQAAGNYAELQTIWGAELAAGSKFGQKKAVTSMMRRVVPIGVSSGGVWTFNFRSLRHVCALRGDGDAAEEEVNALAISLLKSMMTAEVHFFGDFSEVRTSVWAPKYPKV